MYSTQWFMRAYVYCDDPSAVGGLEGPPPDKIVYTLSGGVI